MHTVICLCGAIERTKSRIPRPGLLCKHSIHSVNNRGEVAKLLTGLIRNGSVRINSWHLLVKRKGSPVEEEWGILLPIFIDTHDRNP